MIINKGYIAITSVLVVMAIVLIVGTSVSLLSINDIQSSLSNERGEQALAIVEGCVEDALLRLNNNNNLPSSISIPEGTCSIVVNSRVGNDWTFTTSTTILSYSKSILVSVTRNANVVVNSWIEI